MNNDVNYNNVNATSNAFAPSTYRLILTRPKNFVASLVAFKVFVDGVEVGKIKNGETITLNVTQGNHQVAIHDVSMPTAVMVNGDTTADVVVFATNSYGITNINGQGQTGEVQLGEAYFKKAERQVNSLLIVTIVLIILSVIMLFAWQIVIKEIFYAAVLASAAINMRGLKNFKTTAPEIYKKLHTRSVITIIINFIALIVTVFITNI